MGWRKRRLSFILSNIFRLIYISSHNISSNTFGLREAAKKVIFLMVVPVSPSKKLYFRLHGKPLIPPPLLMTLPLRKEFFWVTFRLSSIWSKSYISSNYILSEREFPYWNCQATLLWEPQGPGTSLVVASLRNYCLPIFCSAKSVIINGHCLSHNRPPNKKWTKKVLQYLYIYLDNSNKQKRI